MKTEIVFVKALDSTFINKDIQILERFGNVDVIHYKRTKGIWYAIDMFLSIFSFIRLFREAQYVFIWFADYHAFLPVFLSKFFSVKSFIFIGGYDAAHLPEINYGAYTNPIRAFCTRYSIRNATLILPVADNLTNKLEKLVGPVKQKSLTIPFGFDQANWYCDLPKEDLIITVSIFETLRRIKIKGLDFFAELASAMPQYQFIVVGATESGKKLIKQSGNLKLLPKQNPAELRKLYARAKVYAQFSISEGLPNAVIESMLCECIPVGTHVGGIPDIIGDSGYILEKRSIDLAKKYIELAMVDSKLGKRARNRVLEQYPMDKREKLFERLLKHVS